ncbi:uridine kinase [uncultured Amnibacterium sp.]|uniref:uridine kinase n=1 Tax=uncultured Amnibacterium sp. TaxID=1631851 RepID=UPI0035CC6DD9
MARWAPARADVLDEYAHEVLGLFPAGRILVGIDGLDGAGTTPFARDLAGAIDRSGVSSAAVSMDGFHHARAVRHAGAADARTWYDRAYDYDAFRQRVIVPFRRGEAVVLDHRSRTDDALLADPPTWVPGDRAVLVVEGVFLHRSALVGLWHTSAWLDVPPETAFAPCEQRDGSDPGDDGVLRRVFFGAEELYLREADPRRRANALFDLSDPEHPRRIFADSC